jgi:predicted transposase YdaD
MAGPFDSIMKRMIALHPEDFAKWLDHEATFVQALDIELKSQHIFADALLKISRNGKPALAHLECQTDRDPEMAVRLLEYNILASRQYHRIPVYSYVIYLREDGEVQQPPYIRRFPDEEGEEVLRFYYRVIKLADIPAEAILTQDWVGLLPLLPLTRGGKEPEIVKTMVDRLGEAREFDLLAIAHLLGGLVFKGPEREAFRKRLSMFQDILEESWVYQEIIEQGLEKGLEKGRAEGKEIGRAEGTVQGQRQALMDFLQTRFPELLALATQQTNSIKNAETLRTLSTKLFAAQTAEEARQILLDVNKQ